MSVPDKQQAHCYYMSIYFILNADNAENAGDL